MRWTLVWLALAVPALAMWPLHAGAQDVGAALRAERWAEAEALTAEPRDPVASDLVRFYRLLTPGSAGSAEIAGFIAEHADWPLQAQLGRRLLDALAVDHDDRGVMTVCARPDAPSALHCADLPRRADPVGDAHRAWLTGPAEPAAETAFMQRWGRIILPDEQWQRFDRLAWTDNGAVSGPAARQAARLDPARRSLAQARLALRRDDASAPALAAALGPDQSRDPGLVLEQARFLRRAGQDAVALAVWLRTGAAAEAAAPAERRTLFWDERNLLARRLLRAGDAGGAYDLVRQHAQSGEPRLDAEFLAGWIALRRLGRAADAVPHFAVLAEASHAAITQARAHYWLARAREAQDDAPGARAEFAQAAAWPTTYYGQLAGRALGDLPARLADLHDPAWDVPTATVFAQHELARAAAILAAWGEGRRARLFLTRLEEAAPDPASRALGARLALDLGWPDQAVAAARRAGRDGIMLPDAGWPMPFATPGTVEPAYALAIVRQESGFDREAASPVGARGLMQLMPATATEVARRMGERVDLAALTVDPSYNMRLGSAYLASVLDQFGGSLPLAAAAYNAGPHRVTDWLAANGDPRGGVDLVDWIEMIPFTETRNYVQRVMENAEIFRAHGAGRQG